MMAREKTPTTLEEAILALKEQLSEADRQYLLSNPGASVYLHNTLGRHLRNEWGLWQGSDLATHIKEMYGIAHPDDMTNFILSEFCRQHIPSVWERLNRDDT